MEAFLAKEDATTNQEATPQPGEHDDPNPAPEAGATDADSAEAQDPGAEGAASNTETQDDQAEHGDPQAPAKKGQLDHLLEAYAKDPTNEGIRKRIAGILGESPRLKQQIKELTDQLSEAKGPPIVVAPPSPADPLAHVATQADLDQALSKAESADANAQAWIDWLTMNPDGGKPEGMKEELSREEVRQKLAEARDVQRSARAVLKAAPSKEKWLKDYAATRAAVKEQHPEFFSEGNADAGEITKLLQEGRITTRHGDYVQDALDLLEGRRARLERQQGKVMIKLDPKAAAPEAAGATQTPQKRPTSQAGTGTRTPGARPAGAGADVAGLRKRIAEGDRTAGDSMARAFLESAA